MCACMCVCCVTCWPKALQMLLLVVFWCDFVVSIILCFFLCFLHSCNGLMLCSPTGEIAHKKALLCCGPKYTMSPNDCT